MPTYEVIVGNIGTVLNTHNGFDAYREYQTYCGISKRNEGRAAGEPVTLMKDGEPVREYAGTLEE